MKESYELPSELTIYGVLDARTALLAWLEEQADGPEDVVDISAAKVAEIDGAGLQLLAALSSMGQAWRLSDPSERFSDACRALGFGHWLKGRPVRGHAGASK